MSASAFKRLLAAPLEAWAPILTPRAERLQPVLALDFPTHTEVLVARITRKELKTDRFAKDVGLTVDFFEEHKKDVVRYGSAVLALALLIAGYLYYSNRQHLARQDALFQALIAYDAPVGAPAGTPGLSFPTMQAKVEEANKRLTTVRTQYSGTDESRIAGYYIGCLLGEEGKFTDAEKAFLDVASNGGDKYGSLAKLALSQIYFSDGRADMGEKILRDLIDNPSLFVTKEEATVSLARAIMDKKPGEARNLLKPLLGKGGAIGEVAASLNNSIPE